MGNKSNFDILIVLNNNYINRTITYFSDIKVIRNCIRNIENVQIDTKNKIHFNLVLKHLSFTIANN